MKLNLKILAIASVVLVIAIAGTLYIKPNNQAPTSTPTATSSSIDVTLNFYNTWLKDKRSTSSDPLTLLQTNTNLTDSLKGKLKSKLTFSPDPIFCRTTVPKRIGAKLIFELEDKAQYMVTGRDIATTTERALVTLTKTDSAWKIDQINCSSGETAPESKFSFEQRGALLKNVPKPLDQNFWYLVYEENNEPGHYIALHFNASSSCTYADNHEGICDVGLLKEATEAVVQGDATETGVEVQFMKVF